MPSWNRLGRLARLATLPETRGLIVATARSTTVRSLARRAVEDRGALLRDLAHPASPRNLARSVIRHPAVVELASAGFLFLPVRFLPLGWVTRRVLRRYLGPPAKGHGDREALASNGAALGEPAGVRSVEGRLRRRDGRVVERR
jgi:hypothetical protein